MQLFSTMHASAHVNIESNFLCCGCQNVRGRKISAITTLTSQKTGLIIADLYVVIILRCTLHSMGKHVDCFDCLVVVDWFD